MSEMQTGRTELRHVFCGGTSRGLVSAQISRSIDWRLRKETSLRVCQDHETAKDCLDCGNLESGYRTKNVQEGILASFLTIYSSALGCKTLAAQKFLCAEWSEAHRSHALRLAEVIIDITRTVKFRLIRYFCCSAPFSFYLNVYADEENLVPSGGR